MTTYSLNVDYPRAEKLVTLIVNVEECRAGKIGVASSGSRNIKLQTGF